MAKKRTLPQQTKPRELRTSASFWASRIDLKIQPESIHIGSSSIWFYSIWISRFRFYMVLSLQLPLSESHHVCRRETVSGGSLRRGRRQTKTHGPRTPTPQKRIDQKIWQSQTQTLYVWNIWFMIPTLTPDQPANRPCMGVY